MADAKVDKWCTGCKTKHPVISFGKDRSRGDGRAAACQAYRKRQYRKTYVPSSGPTPGRRFVEARGGDKLQARRRVNHLVEQGLIPDPNTLPCSDCGEVRPNGKRHEYDHFRGYAAEHHEAVEPVCSSCHHKRNPHV